MTQIVGMQITTALATPTDIDAVFGAICDKITAAGAHVYERTATRFAWSPVQATSTPDDDLPCWVFENSSAVYAMPMIADAAGAAVYGGASLGISPTFYPLSSPPADFRFAVDVRSGAWWVAVSNASGALQFLEAGAVSRRHPADTTQGLAARFALLHPSGSPMRCFPPYVIDRAGVTYQGYDAQIGWYTPIGASRNTAIRRHEGSPLPRMIAPIYPAADASNLGGGKNASAAVMGEFDIIMAATDGYAWAEEAAPGWRVFGDETVGWYALRSPATFEAVTL